MKHVVIVGHPDSGSFNLAIAKAYCAAVEAGGGTALLRDLYRMGFDPCLKNEEVPRPAGFTPGADVQAERAFIADAEVFCFVYPLWFNAPPAMVKGYAERVFGMGFGYGPIREGRNQPLLAGRRMISFTTSGAPGEWLDESGGLQALKTLFDQHLAGVLGWSVIDHVHFGGVIPGMSEPAVEACLTKVRERAWALA